jgi:two-component system, sensor histidine kinase and response regulator
MEDRGVPPAVKEDREVPADSSSGRGAEQKAALASAADLSACTRVLLAVADPGSRASFEALLEAQGVKVTSVGGGEEAFEAVAASPFSVVLMDLRLPEMDGFDAARRLRESGYEVPIVGLAGRPSEADVEQCLAAGMNDCLPEPVSPEALYGALSLWATSRGKPPADTTDLLKAVGRSRGTFEAICGRFLEDSPGQLQAIRQAVEEGSAPDLERAAHRLRGALLVFKAQEAVCLAEDLERCGRGEELSKAPELLARLAREIGRVRAQLAAELRRGAAREAAEPKE